MESSDPQQQAATAVKFHDVLPVLVQHPAVTQDQQVICKLLCISKALLTTISFQCSGLVHLRYSPRELDKTQALTQWLAKHGQLLKSLDIPWLPTGINVRQQYEEQIAAALAQAASAGPAQQLLLQNFTGWDSMGPGRSAVEVLQQLPCHTLTSLELDFWQGCYFPAACFAAVAALSNLQRLRVSSNYPYPTSQIKEGLSLLPARLTSLELQQMDALAAIPHLPTSLLELKLTGIRGALAGDHAGTAFKLGYLTAITSLYLTGQNWDTRIKPEDVLPPNLIIFSCCDCRSAKPLLGLHGLRELHVTGCSMPADQLLMLSSLQELRNLHIGFNLEGPAAEAAIIVYGRLPIKAFTSNCDNLTPTAIQHLARLQTLEFLSINSASDTEFGATARDFDQVLQHLTKLTCLRLYGLSFKPDSTSVVMQMDNLGLGGAIRSGMHDLAKTLAALPRLRELLLVDMELATCGAETFAAVGLTGRVGSYYVELHARS